MTQQTSQQELYRFLEDRFACAQACAECARVCALRAGVLDPDGAESEKVRRKGIMCAEVCEATCRALTEENGRGEADLRIQLAWCRTVCLECAVAFETHRGAGAGTSAAACRECAAACADFLAALG
ncbi:ferredoxin [Streptomyces sp. NPDC004237]|uniref:ferredoxin n=1 Tax=Streptomyces sp. NPDC004237 TaxID=3154455 RepID=UPI0033B49576